MFRAVLVTSIGLSLAGAGAVVGFATPEPSVTSIRTAAPAPSLSQLLGFVDGSLVRVDTETLRALPGTRIAIGTGGCAARQGGTACWGIPPWSATPNGTRVAIARNDSASLLVVDPERLRATARVKLSGGEVGALAWLTPRRLLMVQEASGERQRLVAVDIVSKRVVARQALGGSVQRLGRTGQELVLLVAPAKSIGGAKLAVADRRGMVRFARPTRILAGSNLLGTGSNHRVDSRLPGLAIDRESRRAFVVGTSLVAEVDLRTLAVSYHELQRSPSFLTRLWNWLEPAAHAKQVSGYGRDSRWLGGDLMAVSGADTTESRTQPAGLSVIDTRDWKLRTLDREATGFQVAENLLLATGGRWDAPKERSVGIGLAAYGVDGKQRFQLFEQELAWLAQVYGGRAYVGISGQDALRIVDLASGSVTGTREPRLPWLLLGAGSGWWGDG